MPSIRKAIAARAARAGRDRRHTTFPPRTIPIYNNMPLGLLADLSHTVRAMRARSLS